MVNEPQKLFGTDGMRGVAGSFPLDAATIRTVGASLARQMNERAGRNARFIVGRDTRESGEWIEEAFHAGAVSEGAECNSAGIITTPGVAYLTRYLEFDAGIVISASHNPFQDNGIKIFSPSGKKVDSGTERAIEWDIFRSTVSGAAGGTILKRGRNGKYQNAYLKHLSREIGGLRLNNQHIVVDCANGAASALAPPLFRSLGADVVAINDKPDGKNINENCGSTYPEVLQSKVMQIGANLGVAFDGDADRAIFVDEHGKIVDGDAVLWIMARFLEDKGRLSNKTVIATVMSNIGLETALRSRGLKLVRTAVGDKYVLDELLRTGSELGGEQSGHIIFPQRSLVGDGMLTTLYVLEAILERGRSLSEAVQGFTRYPQTLVNVRVREKRPFESVPEIVLAASAVERELGAHGRLLLRYSGTENLARVMIEGKDQTEIERQANRLADLIKSTLG